MSTMVSGKTQHNNFDLLRVLAASMVLFSHQFALLAQPEPLILPRMSLGGLGVCIFFSISGYLVAQSWLRDPNIFRFILRRFLRIWPALFVATCIAAFIIGPIVTTSTLDEYFHSEQTWRFFRNLRLRVEHSLPGVFATNPFPNAVNGSLWTIPLEVRWYVILLVAGLLRLLHYKWVTLAMLFTLATYHFGIYQSETNPEPYYSNEFGLFFIYGVCMHLFHKSWNGNKLAGAMILSILACVVGFLGHLMIALWLVIPYFVIAFGTSSTPVIRRFGRFGDISYGIYIYAFPVQQFIIWLTKGQFSLLTCLSLSFTITVLLAFASWHLIENPVMQIKPKVPQFKLDKPCKKSEQETAMQTAL